MRRICFGILTLVLALILSLSLFALPTEAKHKSKQAALNPAFSASLARNKLSVNLNFSKLAKVKSITYQLTYDSNKGPQGVGGTIKVKASNLSRRLLLGTCSKNVCTYHSSVKNIKITATYTLKSGGVVSFEKSL